MNKTRQFGKTYGVVGMIICLLIFMFFWTNLGVAKHASVEGISVNDLTETETVSEIESEKINALVDSFISRLKSQYGEDYQYYYNKIINQWGSIEEYLLSIVTEDTPDAVASGWTAFVKWLGEYSPVWGSIFAVVVVIIVVLLGKKALNKVTGFVIGTGAKFKTLFGEVNKIDAALNAQSKALVKLLGENEKFKEERAELEKTAEDLSDDKL